MGRKSKFDLAKDKIVKLFDMQSEEMYSFSDISRLLKYYRQSWGLAKNMGTKAFINVMEENTKLKIYEFDFPSRYYSRYAWGDYSIYEALAGVLPKAYFSHFTALFLNNLTDQIPKKIYINNEQTPKPSGMLMAQKNIDMAFRNNPRVTNNICTVDDIEITLLNGKYTGNLGVLKKTYSKKTINYTSIERTLIDCTIRPIYAGGVSHVLECFRKAQPEISINKLSALLKKLKYIYPYHQAIGLYLEKSGNYTEKQLAMLAKEGFEYDFYLTHNMKDTDYSERWKIHYPKGF